MSSLPVIEVIEIVDSVTNITEINTQPLDILTLDVTTGLSINIFTSAPATIEVVAPVQVLEIIGNWCTELFITRKISKGSRI